MGFSEFIDETEDISTPKPSPKSEESGFGSWYSGSEDSARLGYAVEKGSSLAPDQTAKVMQLQQKTGLPEDVISRNLDQVEAEHKKAQFNPERFRKDNPVSAQWMSEHPNNAALVQDDIENLTAHEKAIQEHGFFDTMYNSLNYGLSTLGTQAARVPALISDVANLRNNLILKAVGMAGYQIRAPKALSENPVTDFFEERKKKFEVPELEQSITEHLKNGEYSKAGRTLAAQFISNSPQQAAIIVAGLSGAGIPVLVGAGALQASDVAQKGREQGQDPAMSTANALIQGSVESGFESIGTFGILKSWEGVIAKNFGKNTSKEVMRDFAKTMFASALGEGNEEGLTSIAQDFSDYITGSNPDALTGMVQRALDSGIVGAASGGAMTSPSAILSGVMRSQNERRVQRAKNLYTAMGSNAEASKLRQRLPEAHKELVARMTKDGPVENIYVPAATIQEYFQSRNEDPAPLMSKVKALDSYLEAKNTGGDVKIPMAEWVSSMVGTEYYQAFQDDIKFQPNDQSVNDIKRAKELIAQEEAAAKPPEPDAETQISESVAEQLKTAGFDESTAGTYSQLFGSTFKNLGERAGVDPIQLFEKYGLKIQRKENVQEGSGTQLKQEPLPVFTDEPNTGEPIAVFSFNWQLDPSMPPVPYYRVYGDPALIDQKLKSGWRSDVSYSKIIEAGVPIVGKVQSATEEPNLPRPQGQQPTELGQQALLDMRPVSAELQDIVFPVSEAQQSIASESDFIKLKADAADLVNQYAKQRGIEPTPELAKQLFQEMHDALGSIRLAPQAERIAMAEKVKSQYPNIESDFVLLRDILYTVNDKEEGNPAFNIFVKGKYQARQEETYYQSSAPTFFSAVEKTVDEKMPAKASPDQVIGMLRNAPGVKQEELDWIGLPEFLQGKKSVTKEEVQKFVSENRVEIQEVTKTSDYSYGFTRPEQWEQAIADAESSGDFAEAERLTRAQEGLSEETGSTKGQPKFSAYQLPGGTNYKEMLLTLPPKTIPYSKDELSIDKSRSKGDFWHVRSSDLSAPGYLLEKSKFKTSKEAIQYVVDNKRKDDSSDRKFFGGHFQEANILAHVRMNDREGSSGERILFLEEIQSDWHQKGRSSGYKGGQRTDAELDAARDAIEKEIKKRMPNNNLATAQDWQNAWDANPDLSEQHDALISEENAAKFGVPDAPFKKTWHELALKRMLRYAAENGYDKIAWTTGEQQADRYDLSKQINLVDVSTRTDSVTNEKSKSVHVQLTDGEGFSLGVNNAGMVDNAPRKYPQFQGKELSEILGKDLSKKIMESKGSGQLSGGDLKVGGEGMKGFYDQIIPSFLNKYTKKWGGKVIEETLADLVRSPDGLRQKSPSEPIRTDMGMVPEKVHALEITPAMKESILGQGQALFQGSEKTPRGMIRFGNDRQFNIDLLKNADLSTFLHETGHFYLEVLSDLATAKDANPQLQSDYKEALNYLGVKEGQKIEREHHEKWARSFEAYLMEGKAPSSELRQAFNRFRAWLISVYQRIQNINVQLSPDVRGVFDRLVASDVQIKSAESEQKLSPLFANPKEFGLTDREAESYQKAVADAHAAAEEELSSKLMAEVRRTKTKAWNDTRQAIIDEITPEVNQRKEYIALDVLQSKAETTTDYGMKTFKLDKKALLKDYPQYALRGYPRPLIYSSENGVHPDIAAGLFGFKTTEEMLFAFQTSPSKKELINQIADERMKELHGDMLTDGSLSTQAMKAVHTNKHAELLHKELKHLASNNFPALKGMVRRIAKRIPTIDSVRSQAQEIIAAKKVRDIQPIVYQRAESKARAEALDLLLKGDIDQAFIAKQRELLNHELYKAADAARTETESIVEYMNGFNKTSTRERIGKAGADYLDQIDSILERYDFRKGQTLVSIDRKKSLLEWVQGQREAGYDIAIPDNILFEAQRKSYKESSYAELEGIRDSVKNIEHLARLKNTLLANEKHRDFTAAKEEFIASLAANHDLNSEAPVLAPSLSDKLAKDVKKGIASHTRMEFLFEYMDGNKPHGVAWETFFKPLAKAEDAETQKMREATKALTDIFGVYSKKERALWFYKKTFIPEINNSLTKGNIMAVALNWGNEYNREALMRGYNWSQSQVEAILNKLDERDWKTVQAVWDHIDSYWKDAETLEKEINGVAPDKVQASEVNTKYGKFKGGYYPIAFDSDQSFRQAQLDERANVSEMFGGNWARAMTRHGHLIAREDTGGKPLLLNLSPMSSHLMNVIHDITHRRAIIDLSKMINDKEVRGAIQAAVGTEMYKELNPWLVSIAGDRRQEPFGYIEKIASRARLGATTVNLGWKVSSGAVQILGYSISAKELGAKYASYGVSKILGYNKIKETWNFITERSEMMRNRMTSYDRDVRDSTKRLNITADTASPFAVVDVYTGDFAKSYFAFVGFMDLATSVPTWIGAYQKAMDGGLENVNKGDEKAAIEYADTVVRKTQSAGGPKDLASIQRGSELHKLFTMFYSQLSLIFNQFQQTYQQFKIDSNVPKLMASSALIWFIPAVLEEVIRGRTPSPDDDKEEWLAWIAKNEVLYPLQSIVLVRDIVSAMDYEYSMSPAANALGSLAKSVRTIGEVATGEKDDITRGDLKNMFNTVGYFAALPTRQVWQTTEYIFDWMTGEESPDNPVEGVWRALLAGKKR